MITSIHTTDAATKTHLGLEVFHGLHSHWQKSGNAVDVNSRGSHDELLTVLVDTHLVCLVNAYGVARPFCYAHCESSIAKKLKNFMWDGMSWICCAINFW